MKCIRLTVTVALFAACLAFRPALAADAVFPPGLRIGLTPLVGLVAAKSFVGFETEDHGVKVLVTELPAAAYNEVADAFKADPAPAGGIKPESIETAAGLAYYTTENAKDGAVNVRRYSMILPGGAFAGYVAVQVPENASRIYTDDAVRQMLASAAIRKEVPVDEQLSLLPFKITALGDFKTIRTLAPRRRPYPRRRRRDQGFRTRALHGDRPGRVDAGAARRPGPVRAAGRDHDPRRARRANYHVGADPDRRPGRL